MEVIENCASDFRTGNIRTYRDIGQERRPAGDKAQAQEIRPARNREPAGMRCAYRIRRSEALLAYNGNREAGSLIPRRDLRGVVREG